jgi:glycosyltransferase involved in cell wall biosynthesis
MARKTPRYDILHVTSAHPADDGRIFYKEALTAHNLGYRVAVVGPHPRAETRHGVDIIPIPKSPVRFFRRVAGPISLLRIIIRECPKVVHFHDPEIIPVACLLQLIGFRVVYDVHEYYSEIQSLRAPAGPFRTLVRALTSACVEVLPCAFFDRSVFPTNQLRRAIAPGPRSIALINLLPKALIPNEGRVEEPEYDLVFMGTISPFRAGPLMEMMRIILRQRPETSLLMLGVKDTTVQWMKENAPSSEVLSAITFYPRVPHGEVFTILRKARVGFNYHPMEKRFEVAIPMKIYEYMACRLPVVCTAFPEVVEQLESGSEIILVEGDEQDSYADAVLNILENRIVAEQIGLAGWRAISDRVNWDVSEVSKVRDLYAGLFAGEADNSANAEITVSRPI